MSTGSGTRPFPRGDPSPEEPALGRDSREEQQRHIRGSALLVVGRVLSMLLSMATSVVLVRVLSKNEYGAFAYALALAAAARVLLSLGQGRLLSRFMAKYQEERDYPRMFGALFLAIGTIFLTSVVCVTAVYLFPNALVGSALHSETAVTLLLILVFLSPLQALDQVFVSLFAVFSKPSAIFFRKFLLAPGLQLVVVLLLALTGASVTFLAVGYVIASLAGILLYVVLFIAALREQGLWKELHPRRIVVPYKDVFEFSFPLITGELALLSFTVGGVFVLGLSQPITEIANYRAVFNPARLNTAVMASFVTLFLPVVARFHTRGDPAGLRNSYWHTAAFVAVWTFPIFALTGPLAPATTVALFGDRYAESATVLAVLSVGYYINVALGFNAYTLQVCGRIRYLVGVNVVVAALNIGLCLVLAPTDGAVGVAIANCVALVTQNLLNQWALRGAIGSRFIDREAWLCYAIIAAGAGLLWGFQLFVSRGVVPDVAAAIVVSVAVLAGSRRALQLRETFPELARIPVLGRFIS
ncbi:MAG TPA: oligosaccharide flippase family protein [Nocardioidaceae bacterium]|jgi:O-antigen/teichoic acid export membrane protein|nr:oligosaccharide flippase family protein [Nocardioidaceae bacterium]